MRALRARAGTRLFRFTRVLPETLRSIRVCVDACSLCECVRACACMSFRARVCLCAHACASMCAMHVVYERVDARRCMHACARDAPGGAWQGPRVS